MTLSDTTLRALKPKSKTFALNDSNGLLLEVLPSGRMVWRFKFHFEGKRPRLTIGPYPQITLAMARMKRDEASRLLAEGINPAAKKQDDKRKRKIELTKASTFQALAEKWFAADVSHMSPGWQYNVRNWLRLDIFPALGKLDPRVITRQDVQDMIDAVIERGAPNSANKVRSITWKIFEHGAEELDERNPVARIKPARTPDVRSHRALSVAELTPFFNALQADGARLINKVAVELLMRTLVRKDELRLAKWSEFDFEERVWTIPGHRTKMGRSHEVYLTTQVVALLEMLKPLSHSNGYVLAGISSRSKPIGHTTLNSLIDRLDVSGARFVPHGFRATASSLLNEARFNPDAIERQLAHKDPNKVRGIYNQAEYSVERRAMLQCWCDFIEQKKQGSPAVLRNSANVPA